MSGPTENDRAARLERAIRLKRAAAGGRRADLVRRPADAPARLGELQASLWLLHQLDPDSAAYNVASAFSAPAAPDVARLQAAFDAVLRRHRILRSTYRSAAGASLDGSPQPGAAGVGPAVEQVIGSFESQPIERIDADGQERVTIAEQAARRPFDLQRGPLVRLSLIEGSESPGALVMLVLHHIIADERSLELLWNELAAEFNGRRVSEDAAQAAQYDDFVHASQQAQRGERRAAELDYWRARLDPFPEPLALPFESRSGEAASADAAGWAELELPPKLVRDVRELARSVGITPFALYAFGYRALLHRYCQGRSVAFATPATLRSHAATAEMIGYFLNAVVIHRELDEAQSVRAALEDFARGLMEDLSHASVPFDVLAHELAPPREPGRHPLFQTMLVHQQSPAEVELDGMRLTPVFLDLGAAKFDLTLFVAADGEAPRLAVEYRSDRFEAGWMEALLGHYRTLLGNLVTGVEGRLSEVAMLSSDELVRAAARASGEPLSDEGALLPARILDQARCTPDAPAVASGDRRCSYGELVDRARAVAAALEQAGVEPGDHVGLHVERSVEMIAGVLACHFAGAAYVPLDPDYPAERTRQVLDDARVTALLVRHEPPPSLAEASWNIVRMAGAQESPSGGDSTAAPTRPESTAYVLYTSGSTGRPKGVIVSHANLRASTAARLQTYEDPPARYLLLPSVAFDSSVAGLFWTLASGGELVVPTSEELQDLRRLAQRIVSARVSHLLCVPSLYAHLLRNHAAELHGLACVIVAGESCTPQLVKEHFAALPDVRLFNEYGPTEATVWASVQELHPSDAAGPISIGRPIPGVRLDVLDEAGRPQPPGLPGLGWISGPTVAGGYWRRPDLSAERFRAGPQGPSYRTGDRMTWTRDGRLLFGGREDEQIKLRGYRIEPGEIEAALAELAGVVEAAVVLVGAGRPQASLVAFVEPVASAELQPEALQAALAERLPDFMVPSRFVVAPLPRLPNGKIDRGALRTRAPRGGRVHSRRGGASDRERALLSLWGGLLRVPDVAVDDNFFELGGHSLLAVEVAAAVQRDFGVDLSPAEVFQSPTVAELARAIDRQREPGAFEYAHLFPIQPSGSRAPLVFCIPHFFSGMLAERFRGERPVYGLRGVGLRQEGNMGRWPTMTALAEDLLREIDRRFPEQRIVLAGYSFGASMAVEAARLLEQRGRPAQRLLLIAPMPLDRRSFGPLRLQLDDLRQAPEQLSPAEARAALLRSYHPLTRRPYARAWRRLGLTTWRRILRAVGRLRLRAGLDLTPRIQHADVRLDRFRLHARYRPGVLHTPTVIFNARGTATDAAATWRPHFAGPFTVHATPDPHLDENAVAAAKELILSHLDDLGDEE